MFFLSKIDEIYNEALCKGKKLKDLASKKLLLETINQYYQALSNRVIKRIEKGKKFLTMSNVSVEKFNKELLSYRFYTREDNEKYLTHSEI